MASQLTSLENKQLHTIISTLLSIIYEAAISNIFVPSSGFLIIITALLGLQQILTEKVELAFQTQVSPSLHVFL